MFTEQQIVFSIRPAESGIWIEEVCRKMGISEATFYNWKKKPGISGYDCLGIMGVVLIRLKGDMSPTNHFKRKLFTRKHKPQ